MKKEGFKMLKGLKQLLEKGNEKKEGVLKQSR